MRIGLSIIATICIGLNFMQYSSAKIEHDIEAYFKSSLVSRIRSRWNKFREAFDDAISRTLKENYHENTMNIYAANQRKDNIVSRGLYAADQSIQLLCLNMVLRSVPRLYMTSVNVALSSNVMRVEGLVEKMFVDTQYHLYRNQTSEVDQGGQDLNRDSPFTFQQVQLKGDLTVLVQDCVLIGTIVTSLAGDSISLGADTLRLAECKFGVEISARAMGQPPVIAPYFSNEKGIELMGLLTKPIREYLLTQLQGTALSYINTTDVFGDKLREYKRSQYKIFELTRDYTVELVSNMNKITIQKNQGIMKLDNLKITMFKTVFGELESVITELANVTVTGLETAYSKNTGGPYKLKSIQMAEAIAFNSLQVRGNLLIENKTLSATSEFSAELLDYTMSVQVDIPKQKNVKFAPLGWRSLEFSIIHCDGNSEDRAEAYSFITGYLSENLPKKFVKYFSEVYKEASERTEKEGAYKTDKQPPTEEIVTPDFDYVAPIADKIDNENLNEEGHLDGEQEAELGGGDYERNEDPHQMDEADTDGYGADAKRLKYRRNVVSQSENEEERISRKRSDKKKP